MGSHTANVKAARHSIQMLHKKKQSGIRLSIHNRFVRPLALKGTLVEEINKSYAKRRLTESP